MSRGREVGHSFHQRGHVLSGGIFLVCELLNVSSFVVSTVLILQGLVLQLHSEESWSITHILNLCMGNPVLVPFDRSGNQSSNKCVGEITSV